MAIYDCFQYFNEDHIVDIRLNILDKYVDYFVISESNMTHQGHKKKLNFDINNFPKFKDKIKYIVADFNEKKKFTDHKWGESIIEQHQRNNIANGIKDASDNDLIILSDTDEIPDLKKLNQIGKNVKFIAFSQMMFMYKLNLQNLSESNWIGSRMCLKKYFPIPQKLRNMKFKKYPFWRIDKPRNIQIIPDGGWHFAYLQSPENISKKIKSFAHGEFNKDHLVDEKKIASKIEKGEDVFERGYNIKKIEIDETFPQFIQLNKKALKDWIV